MVIKNGITPVNLSAKRFYNMNTSKQTTNSGSQVRYRCTQILLRFTSQNFWRTTTRWYAKQSLASLIQ